MSTLASVHRPASDQAPSSSILSYFAGAGPRVPHIFPQAPSMPSHCLSGTVIHHEPAVTSQPRPAPSPGPSSTSACTSGSHLPTHGLDFISSDTGIIFYSRVPWVTNPRAQPHHNQRKLPQQGEPLQGAEARRAGSSLSTCTLTSSPGYICKLEFHASLSCVSLIPFTKLSGPRK